jgi:molybdopterin-containing oxidoreductase family iron-sulfur binding subunit
MTINRRDFLKMAGISATLGFGGFSAFELLRPGELFAATPTTPKDLASPPRDIGLNALTANRWAMAVDVRKFNSTQDVQKCSDACKRTHNVPTFDNVRHDIGWLRAATFDETFCGLKDDRITDALIKKPYAALCNHCGNPPCVRACPTGATFKRKDGIVAMDYHRCVGCRLCMAACPYGARSFNFTDPREHIKEFSREFPTRTKGVVEKCTFCSERLHKGLLPACVEASGGAITVGDIADPKSELSRLLAANYSIRRRVELGTNPSVYYIIAEGAVNSAGNSDTKSAGNSDTKSAGSADTKSAGSADTKSAGSADTKSAGKSTRNPAAKSTKGGNK